MARRFTRRWASRGATLVFLTALCLTIGARAQGSLLVNLGYSYLRLLEAGEVLHHELRIALEPEQWSASFVDDVTVRLTKRTDVLYMTLGADFFLDEVATSDGRTLRHGRHLLSLGSLPFVIYRIDLPRREDQGTELTLRFSYHISPETAVHTFPYLSERLFFAAIPMFWYPQMPTEGYFTATVHLEAAPDGWTMIGEGRPVEGTNGRTWNTLKKMPGLGVVIGDLVSSVQQVAGREVFGWHVPGQPGHVAEIGRRAAEAAAVLEEILGPLPLERFDVVALPWGLGGSLSQYSLFVYDETSIEVPLDREIMRTYMAAHETAHKWIGFTAGTQVLGTLWLSEGLADYLAYLVVERIHGREAMREIIEERAVAPLAADGRRKRALAAIELTDEDAPVAMQKGALVFRALHRRLGDEAFFTLLRTFVREYTSEFAGSRDFTDLMERVGGSAVRRFISDWINGNQELDYALEGVRIEAVDGGELVTFTVASTARLVEPGPVDVEVVLADGSVHTIAAELGAQVRREFSGSVVRITVDPDYWTPDWRRENNVWER